MTESKSLIFFGNERLSTGFSPVGAPTLQALIDAGYQVLAVVSNYEAGTSRKTRQLEIAEIAQNNNIPLLLPNRVNDIKDNIIAFKPDFGVLVAYGKLIPQAVIDIFPKGILNIHPSLLPKYRGSTPIEQALLDGVNETGVSIMQLVKTLDAGPVYAQRSIKLADTETKAELTQKLLELGGKTLIEILPTYLADKILPVKQDDSQATFSPQINKRDGQLDWRASATELERKIRAYATWPRTRAELFGQNIIIISARVANSASDGSLVIECGLGWLEIQTVIAPSGRQISGADFLRGYASRKQI